MQFAQVKAPENSKSVAVPIAGRKFVLLGGMFALGFVLRLFNAGYRFLNADEALHYLLSVQNSALEAYRASLTTVHPPLFILWLHYWGKLGHSEFFLRFPCVVAGTLFCWIMFCWLRRVTNESVAILGVALFLFSPPLIQLSAELRQYAFLLLFCASSLYFFERALRGGSAAVMLLSALALYLALLTHYSSLLFALTLGIYALALFLKARPRTAVVTVWAFGQMLALALVAFLYFHHISKIESSGAAESIADSYLSRSVLHAGQNPLWFIGRSNLRLFHYFFSQGAVGVCGLLLFLLGLILLVKRTPIKSTIYATRKYLALLFIFPLAVNCVLGLARLYPYGGTRHDSYLSIFVFSGIAVALTTLAEIRKWLVPTILVMVLVICNLLPAPTDQYIRLRDQNQTQMNSAVASLRALPAGSVILTDDQGGLLLSYYLCGSRVVQIEQSRFQPFMRAHCGEQGVISLDPSSWIFKAATFPETIRQVEARYSLKPGTSLWLFQAGWFIDKEAALRDELRQYGCSAPLDFGRNMFLCQITVPGPPAAALNAP